MVDGRLRGAGGGRGGRAMSGRGGSPELKKMAVGELVGAGEVGGGGRGEGGEAAVGVRVRQSSGEPRDGLKDEVRQR